jgi:hypothetical protein
MGIVNQAIENLRFGNGVVPERSRGTNRQRRRRPRQVEACDAQAALVGDPDNLRDCWSSLFRLFEVTLQFGFAAASEVSYFVAHLAIPRRAGGANPMPKSLFGWF